MPIIPIGYLKSRNPMHKKAKINLYTAEGRKAIKKHETYDIYSLQYMMKHPIQDRSIEYNDNRLSLYAAQKGKCAVTGKELIVWKSAHCHHKIPKSLGGDDKYKNLTLVSEEVHKLIHATNADTISKYLNELHLDTKQLDKVNKLRVMAELETIKQ